MSKYLGVAKDEVDSLKVKSGLTVGSDPIFTPVAGLGRMSTTITPASVAAASALDQVFAVAGLKVGDFVSIVAPAITPGVVATGARVTIDNALTVTFVNPTAGALVPAAGAYKLLIVR